MSDYGDSRLPESFWSWVYPEPNTGCWLWGGSLNSSRYGAVSFRSRVTPAHRAAYLALIGDIPDGQHIDHLCRVRWCVNPEHLEPVSPSENSRRGSSYKDRCPQGHEYSDENAYFVVGRSGRRCRTCSREKQRAYYQRSRSREQF